MHAYKTLFLTSQGPGRPAKISQNLNLDISGMCVSLYLWSIHAITSIIKLFYTRDAMILQRKQGVAASLSLHEYYALNWPQVQQGSQEIMKTIQNNLLFSINQNLLVFISIYNYILGLISIDQTGLLLISIMIIYSCYKSIKIKA